MKKSIRKKIVRGYWLGEKEKKILNEAVPWPGNNDPDDIEITVPIGPPYVKESGAVEKYLGPYFQPPEGMKLYEPDLPERFVKMWADRNRLRIDAVLHFGLTHVITEVTPTIGAGSTGKVGLYADWYAEDKDVSTDLLQPCIIGRSFHQSIEWYCKLHGVWLGIVPEGGPLEWIYHGPGE